MRIVDRIVTFCPMCRKPMKILSTGLDVVVRCNPCKTVQFCIPFRALCSGIGSGAIPYSLQDGTVIAIIKREIIDE